MSRPDYCEIPGDDQPGGREPCPQCGATYEGNDPVRGVCQARYGHRPKSYIRIVLIDKRNCDVVASTR